VNLEIEVVGKASIKCELVRHLAPTTCRSILTALPIQGRVHRYGDSFVYFETGIVIGAEKQRTQFHQGDIGLLVANGSVCIFLKDTNAPAMNPLGRVVGGLESVESTGPGDVMVLKKPTA
jgi:hypothetical protein